MGRVQSREAKGGVPQNLQYMPAEFSYSDCKNNTQKSYFLPIFCRQIAHGPRQQGSKEEGMKVGGQEEGMKVGRQEEGVTPLLPRFSGGAEVDPMRCALGKG